MLEVSSLADLSSLCQSCSYDLRRSLSTLQFLVQSSVLKPLPKYSSEEKNSIILKPHWQSSHIFDAMYYSNLGEQWNKSPLQILFDDLTSKYTSEYKQSHLLLVNHSKNDAKR
jgi:hypothetical protein